jgi:hypothetical protein
VKNLDFGIGASGKLQALLLVSLAVFMGSLGAGILGAPMHMKPILSYLLKAFIGLVFGGIAAFCAASAFRSVRSDSGLPSDLFAFCLTCGERTPHDLICPVCNEPPQNRSVALKVQTDDWLSQIFGASILTGVGCLGIFIMIGPYLDGERRWWALIAFFALGLLMTAVGAVGLFGMLLSVRDYIKGAKNISFACHALDRSARGDGRLAWGKLVGLQGKGSVKIPLTSQGRSEGGYRVSPGDITLAETLATFEAAGLIEIHDVTNYDWCVGDPSGKTRKALSEFKRTSERQIFVRHCTWVAPYGDGYEDEPELSPESQKSEKKEFEHISRYLVRYLGQPLPMAEFRNKIDADLVYRSQLEIHARKLREQGVELSNALVEAVIEAFLRDKPTSN